VLVIPFSVPSHNEGRLDEAAARIVDGFEVLTAVLMKIRDITLCCPLKVKSSACCLLHVGFLLGLCSSEMYFNGLHDVISQKIEPFKVIELFVYIIQLSTCYNLLDPKENRFEVGGGKIV
jgi:hypothetical protein